MIPNNAKLSHAMIRVLEGLLGFLVGVQRQDGGVARWDGLQRYHAVFQQNRLCIRLAGLIVTADLGFQVSAATLPIRAGSGAGWYCIGVCVS